MKRPSGKTIWLIVLTFFVVIQIPISFLGLVGLAGYTITNDRLDKIEIDVAKGSSGLDAEYVNTIAGIIYKQSIINCGLSYEIDLLKGVDDSVAKPMLDKCKAVGELGLKVLEDLKKNPEKYSNSGIGIGIGGI